MPQVISHAHGSDNLGVFQCAVDLIVNPVWLRIRILQFFARYFLGGIRERHHHNACKNCRIAKQRVEHEHNKNINREPRRVKKCEEAIAGEKLAKAWEVA